MAHQLLVRDLEPELVAAIKDEAKRHGRSVEAEHRAILRRALLPEKSLLQHLREMPEGLSDADFEHQNDVPEVDEARTRALLDSLKD